MSEHTITLSDDDLRAAVAVWLEKHTGVPSAEWKIDLGAQQVFVQPTEREGHWVSRVSARRTMK